MLSGGGDRVAHTTRRTMNTPRWIGSGSTADALAAKKPTCVNSPLRCVGSSWTSSYSSWLKLPLTPYTLASSALTKVSLEVSTSAQLASRS